MCEIGEMPWLCVENGRLKEESKKAANAVFLSLGGHVFFLNVEPMKNRSRAPRRGWGEFVSEIVSFAKKADLLANIWLGENAVENLAVEIRIVMSIQLRRKHPTTENKMPNDRRGKWHQNA